MSVYRDPSGHLPGVTCPSTRSFRWPHTAIKVGAQVIVTSNLKDFPAECLAPWDIEVKSPDDFVLDQIDLDGRVVWACVQQIADSRNNPPETVEDVLDSLEAAGLVEAVAALRAG